MDNTSTDQRYGGRMIIKSGTSSWKIQRDSHMRHAWSILFQALDWAGGA